MAASDHGAASTAPAALAPPSSPWMPSSTIEKVLTKERPGHQFLNSRRLSTSFEARILFPGLAIQRYAVVSAVHLNSISYVSKSIYATCTSNQVATAARRKIRQKKVWNGSGTRALLL